MSVGTFWVGSTGYKYWIISHSVKSSNLDEYYDIDYSMLGSPYENFRLLVVF